MPEGELKPRISLAAGLACFTNPLRPKTSTSGGKIGEHGLTEILCSAGAALFGQSLHLQFVLLLLELLDDGVVEMQRQSLELGRGSGAEIGFGGDVAPQRAHQPDGQYKGASGHEEQQHGAQDQRIGNQPYHQNLPYQRKNWLPTNSASKAMLPRKTPNGI